MFNKRKIKVVAIERERIVRHFISVTCPVCNLESEMLTTRQAGVLAQVKQQSIYRWLASGKAHGVMTPGGRYRICRKSLFVATSFTEQFPRPKALLTNSTKL